MNTNQLLYRQIFWRGLSIALSFAVNVLFARFLGASVNGWVLYQFAVYSVVIQLASLSMETGVAYHTARKTYSDGRLLGFALMWSLAASSVVFGGIVITDVFIKPLDYPWGYAVAFVCGNMLISFGNAFCYAKLHFTLPASVAIVVNFVVAIILAIHFLIVPLPFDMIGLWFCYYLVHGAVLFILILSASKVRLSFRITRDEMSAIMSYSIVAALANLVFLLVTRVDYLFIKIFESSSELGNYAQVSRIATMLFLLPSVISSVLFPLSAAGSAHLDRTTLRSIIHRLLLVNGSICLLLAAIGYWLFPFIYGQSYISMYPAFLLLIPGILAVSAMHPYSAYFSGKNRVIENIRGGILALMFIVPIDVLFIPQFGINAASVASSLGYGAYFFYLRWRFALKHH